MSWPPSSVHSSARIRNLRIDSALETALLASSTAALDLGAEVGVVDEAAYVGGLAVPLGPGREGLAVERDQRRDERPAVADDQALVDQRVGADPVLEDGRGDVLAAGGHQDLLLAAGDPDEALVVDLADVAGVEPAARPRAPRRSPRRCASSRVKTWPPRKSSSPSSATRTALPGSGRPTVPILSASGTLTVSAAGGLGQAVALEHGQPDAAVEVAEPLAERGAAGDGELAAAAERVAQPAVDEPGERRVLGPHRAATACPCRGRASRRSRSRRPGRRSRRGRRRRRAARRC